MGADNRGIIVSGPGRIEAVAIAVGSHSRASGSLRKTAAPREDRLEATRRELEALRQAIAEHRAELAQAEELLGTADRIGEEIGRKQPNSLTLRGLIEGITTGANSVAAVVKAAEAVKVTVAALF